MKKISVRIHCYNEKENIRGICEAVVAQINSLEKYDYEIVLIDNKSTDGTRDIIREMCNKNPKIKAIFNIRNFGGITSPFYALMQCTGDCVISMCADFQDPPDLIPLMVQKWEEGNKVICMIKTKSEESRLMYWLRGRYYAFIKKISDIELIQQFTGFGLYDKSFIDILRRLNDPIPFFRGIVAEFAPDHLEIPYTQPVRRAGKSHYSWYKLYDLAMLSFTSYTSIGLRTATFLGIGIAFVSIIIALVYFIMKLVKWNSFVAGTAPIVVGMFFLGAVQLIFLGLIGEYILRMNQRIINRPLVVEEERINFD